jgi:glycosyltransferase involved in cell wall biosynthesis
MPDGEGYGRIVRGARPRILLLLASLHGGGAERVATHLLERCDPERLNVRMALLQRSGPYLAQTDARRIDVSPIGERWLNFEGHNSNIYRPHKLAAAATLAPVNVVRMVRQFRPDVVISFLKGMSLLAYLTRPAWGPSRPRWIAREGNNTHAVIDDEVSNALGRSVVKRAVATCYRAADAVLASSHGMARDLQARLGLDPSRLSVIHNPLDVARIQSLAAEPLEHPPERPFIVSAGRLEPQKGHELLLKAFAASPACRELDLVILGQGSQEAALRRLARQLGVASRLKTPGFVANPWAWIARARLFVLPSLWEGFASAAAEALACGVPALVTDCDFGPSEVIEHGTSGWVARAGDVGALGAAIDRILLDSGLAAALSRNALRRARAFDVADMVEAYSALFVEQASARRQALVRLGQLQWAEV